MIYRGKDKKDGEWVVGYLVKYQPNTSEDKWIVGIVPTYASALYIIEVIPETVGQCVGEWNGNGKNVFVGDIIKHHFGDEIGVVKFGEYKQFFNDNEDRKCIGFYIDWVFGANKEYLRKDLNFWIKLENNYDYKIFIGNIHDNPELIKVGGISD